MTRKAWIAVGCLSALSLALAAGLAISLADGDDPDYERAGFPAPSGDQLEGPAGAPLVGGPPEELRECMSDEGVELPEPGQEPSEQDQEALRKAFKACADVVPQVGPAPPGGMIEP